MRNAALTRTTKETDIAISIELDGTGRADINTGIGFFDHMLTALCVHAGWDLTVNAKGDLYVDAHHTVEDVGILLGMAFLQSLGSRSGISRYGECSVPMDETLAQAVVDISGRPFLVFKAEFEVPRVGFYETQLTEEFWRAFTMNAQITLHLNLIYGSNDHHKAEALFKAAAHAMRKAAEVKGEKPLSTKGIL